VNGNSIMILSDKKHKARKSYTCCNCGANIAKGEEYHRRYGGWDKHELHERILCKKCYEHMTDIEEFFKLDIYEIEAENDYCHSDVGNY